MRARVSSGPLGVVREGTYPHTYSTCARVVGASDSRPTRAVSTHLILERREQVINQEARRRHYTHHNQHHA